MSALHAVNADALLEAIDEFIPTPTRDETKPPYMLIARSFDVNKPGTTPESLRGGVLGGSILQGVLRVGDEVEIRPGLRVEKGGGRVEYEPLLTEVAGLRGGDVELKEARPGGLIGVGTTLDPSLTKADALVGNVEQVRVEKIKPNEQLMLNVGTATTLGIAQPQPDGGVRVKLRRPVCVERGGRVALSRQIGGRFRLIGYCVVK
jgi:translation initiation factor 2 subunit 3